MEAIRELSGAQSNASIERSPPNFWVPETFTGSTTVGGVELLLSSPFPQAKIVSRRAKNNPEQNANRIDLLPTGFMVSILDLVVFV
jgi:hypothetical protein